MHIIDWIVEGLRTLVREVVEEVIEEREGLLTDPDGDAGLQPEIAASLDEYLASDRTGDDAAEVFRGLKLK